MKLYFAPRTRATRARWLLEELGLPYELVRLDLQKEENKSAEYLALNPFGELPVLVDGTTVLTQSASILLYLADRHPEQGFAPPVSSPARVDYLEWLVFSENSLEPLVLEFFWNAQRPDGQKRSLEAERARLDRVLGHIQRRLDGRSFIAGDSFTAADLSVASILHLANTLQLLGDYPKLFDYTLLHAKRPAVRRAVTG